VTADSLIQLQVDVRNTSGVPGDEVLMVFARYPSSTVMRSPKELKGFARVALAGGEAKRVTIPVRVQDMRYWDDEAKHWVIEGGTLELSVGPSSDPAKLSMKTTVQVQAGTLK
jgi:beta-glucosidase